MYFEGMADDTLREMVERVSWFRPVDYEILLFFENHDIICDALTVAANIDYDRQYVNKRMRAMQKAGIFENYDGLYELSDLGHEFLAGNVDSDELKQPE